MRRLVLLIEIAFVILIISIIYRRYIKPFREAIRSAKNAAGQQQYREQRGPVQDSRNEPRQDAKQSSINTNPHKPIDRTNVQDAEFEDLT